MSNVIYRGPVAKEPQTISNRVVAGAYLPGIFVTDDGTTLTVATAADMGKKLYLLSNREFQGQDVATAYASGDTAVAYEPMPGEIYQARMAAATYAIGDELTIGADGHLTKVATVGDVTVAYFSGTAGALSAGDLADVSIATGHRKIA